MRDFNKAQFEAFRNGAGKGMSLDDAKAKFEGDPGFAENEARANSIAKEILKLLNKGTFNFDPKFGYASC